MDYGFVENTPQNIQKGDYYMKCSYDVARTGEHQQFYTLYRSFFACLSGYWSNTTYSFMQNLAHDKEEALEKARQIAGQHTVYFVESPQADRNEMSAFNLHWKKGPRAWYAEPDQAFWDIWRTDKAAIKAQGYWVSKSPDDGRFTVFLRHKGITYNGLSIDELIAQHGSLSQAAETLLA